LRVVKLYKENKMPNKRRGKPDVEPSDSESSSSDWDNDAMPNVICKAHVPILKSLATRTTGMAAGDCPGEAS